MIRYFSKDIKEELKLDLNLNGKKVLVTGASKGIGLSIATVMAEEKAEVMIVSHNKSNLIQAKSIIKNITGISPKFLCCDLSKDCGREDLFANMPDADIVINNAGDIPTGTISDLSINDWRRSWQLKVFGYIHLSSLYANAMINRQSGTIINIIGMVSSAIRNNYICGVTGNAALEAFTNSLGAQTAAHNVRVFGINPTLTLTGRVEKIFRNRAESETGDAENWQAILDKLDLPFSRPTSPEEVARITALLASPRASYLSGTVINFTGGVI